MMFINTFKILFSNFIQFWKIVINKLCVLLLVALFLLPFINTFLSLNFIPLFNSINDLLVNLSFVNVGLYFQTLYNVLVQTATIANNLFVINPFCFVYTCVILFAVFPFLINLSDVALGEVLYGSMTSLTKVSFVGSYIKNIGKSSVYSVFKTLISVPIFMIVAYLEFLILKTSLTNELLLIFAPFIMISLFSVIWSLKNCIISGWMPSIVVFPTSVFGAFSKGLKAVSRRFFRCFSTILCMTFLWCLIICLFGPVSLLIVIPFAYVLHIIFQMVMLFGSQGMRYYVDLDTILTPKKLEETDKYSKAKKVI